MKVTVTFSTVKIVVPCGDGELTVRELTQLATTRYKKATGKPRNSWVSVHSLKAKEGGILDPDDRLVDVCDDREQLIAFYDEEGIPQGGDGMSASSDESEPVSSLYKTDSGDIRQDNFFGGPQQMRQSDPVLGKLHGSASTGSIRSIENRGPDDSMKRWSSAGLHAERANSKNDLSVIDEASFCSESNQESAALLGGKHSPLPPPFERGRGSGAARDSDRPTPFLRDSNRLSIQICHEDGKWLEAAEKASQQYSHSHLTGTNSMESGGRNRSKDNRHRAIDAKIEMFENASVQRREPLGGISPSHQAGGAKEDEEGQVRVVIQNEIGPLGIHVVPSGDPDNPGLVIQGIEPGGRIDRDGRLAVNDRIVEINNTTLKDLPFNKAQEIFKDALFSKDLNLLIEKSEQLEEHNFSGNFFMSDENKENIDNESENVGTFSRKFGSGAGSKLTNAVQVANTRKLGKKISIKLVKGMHGLGFSITTRDIQSGGVAPIYIKHILPKGAAIENGQLKPGDRLLEINQQVVDGKSQSEVVTMLRNIPQNSIVTLVVSRQELVDEMDQNAEVRRERSVGSLPGTLGRTPKQQATGGEKESSSCNSTVPNSEESEEFTSISPDLQQNPSGETMFPWKHREILTLDIPVHDTERAGLGVSVKGKTTGGGSKGIVDLGIFVKNVINGGAASRDGRLKTNDQLVNINGISLLGKANCDAMDTLRRAMHEEGPTPGVITLTVARRLNIVNTMESGASRGRANGRDSVTSILTSSSGDESYREYRINSNDLSRGSFNNSSLTDTSINSPNETVIYVEKPKGQQNVARFDNFLTPAIPRNPVVDRLMGRKDRNNDIGLRNESYYRATGHDTWNATMLQTLDTTDGKIFGSPSSDHNSPDRASKGGHSGDARKPQAKMSDRPNSPDGCEGQSERSSKISDSDVAYASQTSLEETLPAGAFSRDQPGRQSMSEKRHATLDAKTTDTYQRNKRARQEREKTKGPIGPMLGMKKSSSLESLQTMMTEMKMENGRQAARVKTSRVVRGRGCNESFRAAVDRSYEAQDSEDQQEADLAEFDRAEYRQSGSSLDSNHDKKKKNAKLFKFGMFKFGKQRAKSTDALRNSGRKTPTPGAVDPPSERQTPTRDLEAQRKEEEREKMLHEQAKIQQHYRRLLQQRNENEAAAAAANLNSAVHGQQHNNRHSTIHDKVSKFEEVYSGDPLLPASLAAARPGSRTGITGTAASDPRFANYDEIQRHLNRRQAQYHSQRREHPSRCDRPVSNFYEYESVQSGMGQGRLLASSGFPHNQPGLPGVKSRGGPASFSPPRHAQQHPAPPGYGSSLPSRSSHGLSVAPLPSKYSQFSGRGDYDEFPGAPVVEDPYGRLYFGSNHDKNQSHSSSRIQSLQVPKSNAFVPSLPPGSKV